MHRWFIRFIAFIPFCGFHNGLTHGFLLKMNQLYICDEKMISNI